MVLSTRLASPEIPMMGHDGLSSWLRPHPGPIYDQQGPIIVACPTFLHHAPSSIRNRLYLQNVSLTYPSTKPKIHAEFESSKAFAKVGPDHWPAAPLDPFAGTLDCHAPKLMLEGLSLSNNGSSESNYKHQKLSHNLLDQRRNPFENGMSPFQDNKNDRFCSPFFSPFFRTLSRDPTELLGGESYLDVQKQQLCHGVISKELPSGSRGNGKFSQL